MSLADVADLLVCPHCRQPLSVDGRTLRCTERHSFDLARQGYVNLLTRPAPVNADTPAMIAAREQFLDAGHYRQLGDRLATLAAEVITRADPVIVEPGAGTGYYLAQVLSRFPAGRGLALDLSAAGCRRAARIDARVGAVVADTWAGLPIADQRADLIMVVFAPRNAADFGRLLRPDGRLVVAAAGADHLTEIRQLLGLLDVQPDKQQRISDGLSEHFSCEHTEQLTGTMRLGTDDLLALITMGPNAHHQSGDLRSRIEQLAPPLDVTRQVELSVFRPHKPG